MSVAEKLLTIEEFVKLPDDGVPRELVRGKATEMNIPTPRHGFVCSRVSRLVGNHVEENDLGRVMTNDSGVVTARDPDSLRGADVAYYSFERLPRGPMPEGYLEVVPEVVFEILSQYERWPAVLAKTAEYLAAGVDVVCVLDPAFQTLQIFRSDQAGTTLQADDDFNLPEFFGEFTTPVRALFG